MRISTPPDPSTAAERVARWRADTPGCEGRIHLNNAGAGLMPRSVLDAITEHLQREAELGGYEAAEAAADAVQQSYGHVARLIGAKPHNIAVVENATVAFAQALSAFDFRAGDVIVTTTNDYISNQLMYLSLAARQGVEIVRAADAPGGGVDPESVREKARHPRCRLVAVTWVPTNSGLVQPVEAVGEVCRELDVPYLVDACQAVGQLPVDVAALRCDYLSATARKFLRGPRGAGFLYVSDRALARDDAPLFLDMRGADWVEADRYRLFDGARRFENWEFAYGLVLGLGEAARYAVETAGDPGFARTQQLAAYTRRCLARLSGVRVLDEGREPCAIVTAEVAGYKADNLKQRLHARAINIGATYRAYAVIDMDRKRADTALRLSPHYYNTEGEIDETVAVLEELLSHDAA